MSFRPANSAQRRAKVVQAGEGMRLNVQGIVFSYKAVGEDTEGRYALTEGMVPRLIMGHRNTSIIGKTRRSMSSKASLKSNAAARSSKPVQADSRCYRRVFRTAFKTCRTSRARSYACSRPANRGIL